MKTYYERLRELREDNDLTQADIAKLLKTTQQVYSRYEKGINEIPVRHLVTKSYYVKGGFSHLIHMTAAHLW